MLTDRYTHPQMGHLWSEQKKFETWLEVEIAAAEAMAAEGIVPSEAVKEIKKKASFSIERIEAIERDVKHDVVAFTQAVAETVGEASRWIHFGLTSSDVVDTALALRLRDAADLILVDVDALRTVLRNRASDHKRTLMVGRTHGVHAEPMTFGLKLALWYAEIDRSRGRLASAREGVAVGKLSGAVGTFAHLAPSIEEKVCRSLGLVPAPISSQILGRDRHAEMLTEIREVEEFFDEKQKGSSSMPHKRNPVGCEQVSGLARVVRSNLQTALENIPLWHERDISHSSAERMILPSSFILTDHILRRMTNIVDNLIVYPEKMRENLESMRGLVFSGQVLLELAKRGLSREESYRIVQRNAMAVWSGNEDFKSLLAKDPEVGKVLSPAELNEAFDFENQMRQVDTIFQRVFGS
jgi:adenylosuccinate lyase